MITSKQSDHIKRFVRNEFKFLPKKNYWQKIWNCRYVAKQDQIQNKQAVIFKFPLKKSSMNEPTFLMVVSPDPRLSLSLKFNSTTQKNEVAASCEAKQVE